MENPRGLALLPEVYDIPWEFGSGLFLMGLSWLDSKTACTKRLSVGRPVVYLHGTAVKAGSLAPMRLYMAAQGHGAGHVFEFESSSDFDGAAQGLADKLDRIVGQGSLGADEQLTLIGHSLGGLIIRSYLQLHPARHPVGQVFLLATPNYGTHLAHYFPTEVTQMMLPGSAFLAELNDGRHREDGIRYVSMYGDRDLLVLPRESMHLEGSRQMVFKGLGHNKMVLAPVVMAAIAARLDPNAGLVPA